jgi:hypothetical protein
VPWAAEFTGPFDAAALDDLVVEVCELSAEEECIGGPPVERFTSSALPMPSRLALNEAEEFCTVRWVTGPSLVSRDPLYRVRVFRAGIKVGSIDVDFVQNMPELASVDPLRAIGVVRGQQLTLRFRVQQPTGARA